jgi:hypothetical protein
MRPSWPLGLASSPGSYGGAVALAVSLGGWRSERRRGLFVAFVAYGALCYLATLHVVVRWVSAHMAGVPGSGFYLHDPTRFRYGVLIAVPILAGLGVEAWREHRTPPELALILAPGIVLFWLLPAALGVPGGGSTLFLAGAAAAVAVAASTAEARPALLSLMPVLVAVELCVNGMAGRSPPYSRNAIGSNVSPAGVFPALQAASIHAAAYVREGPIALTGAPSSMWRT